MQINDKRKIINRNSAIKTIGAATIVIVILGYLGVKSDHIILGLLVIILGIFTYFTVDYDDDIEDIKNEIKSKKM